MHIQYLYSLLYWQDSPNHDSVKEAFIKITGFAGKCFLFLPPLPIPSPSIFCSRPNFSPGEKTKNAKIFSDKIVSLGDVRVRDGALHTAGKASSPRAKANMGIPQSPPFTAGFCLCSFRTALRIRGFRLLKGKGILFFRKEANNTRAALFKEQFSILLRR